MPITTVQHNHTDLRSCPDEPLRSTYYRPDCPACRELVSGAGQAALTNEGRAMTTNSDQGVNIRASVRAAMDEAGVSVAEVCRRTGMSRKTFDRRMRTAGTTLTLNEVCEIAQALGTSPSRLCFGPAAYDHESATARADQEATR